VHRVLINLLAQKYDAFLASEVIIKQIPRLAPGLSKAGKFPALITHSESLVSKVLPRDMNNSNNLHDYQNMQM
jgi:large subunit ribosomal protein L10Ae